MPTLRDKVVLDCGCGHGVWGYLMRSEKAGKKAYIIGMDIDKGKLDFCKIYHVYDELIQGHAGYLPFTEQSIDICCASELIEHMHKDEGKKFLRNIECICKGLVIVTTPNGFRQSSSPTDPYQLHKSKWGVRDFKGRGWKVHGIGLKWSWFLKNQIIWGFLRYAFTSLSYVIPELSEMLVAVRSTS